MVMTQIQPVPHPFLSGYLHQSTAWFYGEESSISALGIYYQFVDMTRMCVHSRLQLQLPLWGVLTALRHGAWHMVGAQQNLINGKAGTR